MNNPSFEIYYKLVYQAIPISFGKLHFDVAPRRQCGQSVVTVAPINGLPQPENSPPARFAI